MQLSECSDSKIAWERPAEHLIWARSTRSDANSAAGRTSVPRTRRVTLCMSYDMQSGDLADLRLLVRFLLPPPSSSPCPYCCSSAPSAVLRLLLRPPSSSSCPSCCSSAPSATIPPPSALADPPLSRASRGPFSVAGFTLLSPGATVDELRSVALAHCCMLCRQVCTHARTHTHTHARTVMHPLTPEPQLSTCSLRGTRPSYPVENLRAQQSQPQRNWLMPCKSGFFRRILCSRQATGSPACPDIFAIRLRALVILRNHGLMQSQHDPTTLSYSSQRARSRDMSQRSACAQAEGAREGPARAPLRMASASSGDAIFRIKHVYKVYEVHEHCFA